VAGIGQSTIANTGLQQQLPASTENLVWASRVLCDIFRVADCGTASARRCGEGFDLTKRMLFLAAVFVSLTMPVLANEVGFRGREVISSGTTGGAVAVPNGVAGAILFNAALTDAQAKTPLGNRQSVFASTVEDRLDGSTQRSFSSIVKIDDGAISISVPEPGTMGTLAIGLAMMIVCLVGVNEANPSLFYIKPLPKHSFLFWPAYSKHGMEAK
jgi:hypothetical protein